MSSAPVVAHVAPNGLLGGPVLARLAQATKDGELASLKIISSKETDKTKDAASAAPGKVTLTIVDYSDKSAVAAALKGVDVLVSTFGGRGAQEPLEEILIQAAAEAGVKVYIPSDFGSDYDPDTYGASAWEPKKAHRIAAEKLGLKTVALATGPFYPFVRSPFFFNYKDGAWEITGDGSFLFASSALPDIAQWTLRTIILAHTEPPKVPSRVRVYSSLLPVNEYVSIAEKASGKPQTKTYVSRDEYLEKLKASPGNILLVARVSADSPAHDFSKDNHVELLNPGQKYFKPTSWEEFVKASP